MKKIVLLVTAALGLMVGSASTASATEYVQYPPPPAEPWVSPPQTVEVSTSVTYTVGNAIPGELITFTVNGVTYTAGASAVAGLSADSSGSAAFTFTAPATVGTFPIKVHLATSNVDLSTAVTTVKTSGPTTSTTTAPTPGGKLPATGAGGTTQGLAFAGVLLAAGASLTFVARRRRAAA